MSRLRPAGALAAVAMMALAACSASAAEHEDAAHDHVHTQATSLGRPDEPIAGPQGDQAQFVVECGFSHAASDDPIVYPGEPGRSHLHTFFGNTDVDSSTTTADLLGGDTTCDHRLDTAAYWAPALLVEGEMVQPVKSTAYYRPGLGVDPTTVQPYPAGLQMVAGNSGATSEQPLSIVAWTCGVGIARSVTPPSCAENRNLRLLVTFPDCWNGTDLDSDDHHAHVAYSSGGVCPDGFAVPIPQLQFAVEYPVTDPTGLVLASGGLLTGHADFMNGWDQDALVEEVELCLHRDVVCGVSSGKLSG